MENERTALERLLPRLAWYRPREQNESLLSEERNVIGSVIGGSELYLGARTSKELEAFAADARLELESL